MTTYDYNELKRRLVQETKLHELQNYFFTEFVERGPFMKLGRCLSDPRSRFLVTAVSQAYCAVTKSNIVELSTRLIEIPEIGFIHGSVNVGSMQGSVFYFEDISTGLFTLVANPVTGETKFMRFRAERPFKGKPN